MVRISATGEIIHDGDTAAPGQQGSTQPPTRQIHQGFDGEREPVQHMPDGTSMFDTLNQRLLDAGIPRINLGSWTVEPIVLLGFLLAFLLMGFNGILFAGLLFAVAKWSQRGAPTGGQVPNTRRGGGPGGQGRSPGGPPRSGWGSTGSGNRLGR